MKLMKIEELIDNKIIRFLLTGGVQTELAKGKTMIEIPSHMSIWLNKVVFVKICELESSFNSMFKGFSDSFTNNLDIYNEIFDKTPAEIMDSKEHFPGLMDKIAHDKKEANRTIKEIF